MNQKESEQLNQILLELETVLLMNSDPINLPNEGIRSVTLIFSNVMLDRMWKLQEKEKMEMVDRIKMSENFGKSLRELIKTYTDIDTFNLVENNG